MPWHCTTHHLPSYRKICSLKKFVTSRNLLSETKGVLNHVSTSIIRIVNESKAFIKHHILNALEPGQLYDTRKRELPSLLWPRCMHVSLEFRVHLVNSLIIAPKTLPWNQGNGTVSLHHKRETHDGNSQSTDERGREEKCTLFNLG